MYLCSYFPVVFPGSSFTETCKLSLFFFSNGYFKSTSFSTMRLFWGC